MLFTFPLALVPFLTLVAVGRSARQRAESSTASAEHPSG